MSSIDALYVRPKLDVTCNECGWREKRDAKPSWCPSCGSVYDLRVREVEKK